MTNKSDYNKTRTQIEKLLPAPYQSETNATLMENTINRFLTKQETVYVDGYVGNRNTSALTSRQINEDNIISQADQLQPIITAVLGTEKRYMAWTDVINELEELGVNMDTFPDWGRADKYNWVPPVDLDKLIHFRDYFWVNPNANSLPEYITIRSVLNEATARLRSFELMIERYGALFPIVSLTKQSENIHTLVEISDTGNFIRIAGDLTPAVSQGDFLEIIDNNDNNGQIEVVTINFFDDSNTTVVSVPANSFIPTNNLGRVRHQTFNGINVAGDLTQLFEPNFITFIRSQTNTDISNKFVSVVSSSFDGVNTTVVLDEIFSNAIVDGDISLQEQVNLAASVVACETGTISLYDTTLWDDNSSTPEIWNGDFESLIADITNVEDPTGFGTVGELWFATASDILFSYTGDEWRPIYNNFLMILDQVTNTALFDFSEPCGTMVSEVERQWTDNNFWVHRTDVVNFASARQANYPIIEFFRGMQLNEHLLINHLWRYRTLSSGDFMDATHPPTTIELDVIDTFTFSDVTLVIGQDYGDLTNEFPVGFMCRDDSDNIVIVNTSSYQYNIDTDEWNTVITTEEPLATDINFLQPLTTSFGAEWLGYNRHWAYGGIVDEVPAIQQPRNFLNDISDNAIRTEVLADDGNVIYITRKGSYAQEYSVVDQSNTVYNLDESLNLRVLANASDIRVYINEKRLYGNYVEISDDGIHVSGIRLIADNILSALDTILIELAPAVLQDHGRSTIRVRTVENDSAYSQLPFDTRNELLSIVKFKKIEQIKSSHNQHPLYNTFNPDGSDANSAQPLFAYKTSADAPVATELGIRVVVDITTQDYTFTQSLMNDEDMLFAYANNPTTEFWVNKSTMQVFKNLDNVWVEEFIQGNIYGPAIYSNTIPFNLFNGLVWFNAIDNTLNVYSDVFTVLPSVTISDSNPSLNTIWQKAADPYVPELQDWHGRSLSQYNNEQDTFVNALVEALRFDNPDIETDELFTKATSTWFVRQQHPLSPDGRWKGDWTIPDYLYFNPENRNRINITSRELTSHVESIINSQDSIPGYTGNQRAQYHVLTRDQLDLGAGGRIHQYNNNFSTFISSVFVDNIVVPDLIEFAQTQYQILLDNSFSISSTINLLDQLSKKPANSNIQESFTDSVISTRTDDSNLELIYGDSTTFDSINSTGIKNWIATLPNIGAARAVKPSIHIDKTLNLYELTHHDGHSANYVIDVAARDGIVDDLIEIYTNDNSHGIVSNMQPPSTFTELSDAVPTQDLLLRGYYWIDKSTKKIYVSYVDYIQSSDSITPQPLVDGFWFDTNRTTTAPDGQFMYSDGIEWLPVNTNAVKVIDGTTIENSRISLWREVDVSELVLNSLLEIETRLYNVAKDVVLSDIELESNLEEYFLAYTKDQGIEVPFINADYSPADPFTWNYTNSIFGTPFTIINVDIVRNAFLIQDTDIDEIDVGTIFYIKNSGDNDGAWTVTAITENLTTDVTTLFVTEDIKSLAIGNMYIGELPSPTNNTGAETASYWKPLYTAIYGTPYPHLEPWKLQGYTDKPIWWDAEYVNDDPTIYGARRWKQLNGVGMWDNILNGRVPIGMQLPNELISTGTDAEVHQYNYLSVNISDNTLSADSVNFYSPDDLYPPFFEFEAAQASTNNRSLFSDFTAEVMAPASNFTFGDNFRSEYEWRVSSQYLYDIIAQTYVESPINTVSELFGFDLIHVDGLAVDNRTGNVPSYKRTEFHGTINGTVPQQFNGLNQWYVNYNRYTGLDTNFSNFLQLWTRWTAPLSYSFNSFIDARTLDIGNTQIQVEKNIDFSVHVKRTNGIDSFSIDGLNTTLVEIPPRVVNFDNSHLWKIQISNNSNTTNSIPYYGVRNYPFYADPVTNIMKIFTYQIVATGSVENSFELAGDLTDIFVPGTTTTFTSGAMAPVFASVFNADTDRTVLHYNTEVTVDIGEVVSAQITTIPWETGDTVFFTTERQLPAPLFGDNNVVGPTQYFIIKLSDTEFRVAETPVNAQFDIPVALINSGISIHYVGEIVSTFIAANGANTDILWRHYKLDTRIEYTANLPSIINGVQQYIDLVDGYVAKLEERGFTFSQNAFGWQSQIETFIDYSFSVRQRIRDRTVSNRFGITPDVVSNTWTWDDGFTESPIPNGFPVNLTTSDNMAGLPAPFLPRMPYYLIINFNGTFSLAASQSRAMARMPIIILDAGSNSNIQLHAAVDNVTRFPRIEVNTFREVLSFSPPFGVLSDVVSGPFDDINTVSALRDQYGDPLLPSDFTIHRHDKSTDIRLTTERRLDTTVDPTSLDAFGQEGFHYISSATFHIDTYEHIVEFNDYTDNGDLIYDSFIGLNLNRLDINFNRPEEATFRPNIGGSTVITEGRNLTTMDNIERMTDDLRYAYGSVSRNESNRYAPLARSTLGYDINSTEDYLNSIGINEQSQFRFWQGLIQVKGSARSINSFINSRRFIDARIDEFWAYEIASFGSTEEREYPQMFINPSDVVDNNAKFEFIEFIEATEIALPGYDAAQYGAGGYDIIDSTISRTESNGFKIISINDDDRWYEQPDQLELLEDNGLTMYFERSAKGSIDVDLNNFVNQNQPIIQHDFMSDGVAVTVDFGTPQLLKYTVRTDPETEIGFDDGGNIVTLAFRYIPFIGQLKVFKNGIPMRIAEDYFDTNQQASDQLTVNQVQFIEALSATDVIEVSLVVATLNPTSHYDTINSNIIRFNSDEFFSLSNKMTIWNLQPNFEAHNASKLIDVVDRRVVDNINLFDPARGIFNQQVSNDVDIITNVNPATFNRFERFSVPTSTENRFINKRVWNSAEVGTIWLDTRELAYVPYYDINIFTDVDDRLEQWGNQADYSNLRVLEWVESDVPPEEYAEAAIAEQGDATIPEHLRKSGTPRSTLFHIDRGTAPDFNLTLVELYNNIIEYSAMTDGISNDENDDLDFNVPLEFLNTDFFNRGSFGVYVNGVFSHNEFINTATGTVVSAQTVTLSGLSDADLVQIVISYNDIADDVLQQAIDDEIVRVSFNHTEIQGISDIGEDTTMYYFWVEHKLTRASGNSVSANTIESQWTSVDYPYMVLQNARSAGKVDSLIRENFDLSYTFTIDENHDDGSVQYLQIGQGQREYSIMLDSISGINTTPDNGIYNPGVGYQPDDIIELDGGVLIRVISSDGSSAGEVTDFEVVYNGIIQPSIGDVLQQLNISTVSPIQGSGFSLTPSVANFGGFPLKLASNLSTVIDARNTLMDSRDTLVITLNGRLLTERSNITKSGEYIIVSNKLINITSAVSGGDIVTVSYESNRPALSYTLPDRYTQAIIRNLKSTITDDNRYTVRFRKDFTDDSESELDNKTLHKEWKMFRQHQQTKIDRILWDKVTESMIGHLLTDSNEPVPSMARRLYDMRNDDDTRFGIGRGQAFTDGQQAIETLLSDINDVENEFRGVDIASFINSNLFDTSDNIINSMNIIYTTFPTEDVNRLYFLFLNDALSNKLEYAKILKTSMISVYGVKVLNSRDLFDE